MSATDRLVVKVLNSPRINLPKRINVEYERSGPMGRDIPDALFRSRRLFAMHTLLYQFVRDCALNRRRSTGYRAGYRYGGSDRG